MEDLSTSQKLTLEQYFNNQIFPLLTPLDMDAPEAPALPSLKLLMGVELRDNETGEVRSAVVAPSGRPAAARSRPFRRGGALRDAGGPGPGVHRHRFSR